MAMMISPEALSKPAASAGVWPKLRRSSTKVTRGSLSASCARSLPVPSVEPSSTKTIS